MRRSIEGRRGANVRLQQARKQARFGIKYAHNPMPKAVVIPEQEQCARHQCRLPEQRLMTGLVRREISRGQTIAQQRGLFEGEAEALTRNRVHAA